MLCVWCVCLWCVFVVACLWWSVCGGVLVVVCLWWFVVVWCVVVCGGGLVADTTTVAVSLVCDGCTVDAIVVETALHYGIVLVCYHCWYGGCCCGCCGGCCLC